MKRSTSFLCITTIYFVAVLQSFPSHANVLFSDGFESGNFSSPLWGSKSWSVSVSTDRASSGKYSAKFKFSSTNEDAWAELRFDLGKLYPALWIKYKLYIPTNYIHRDSNGSDNNKFFRLWGIDYADKEKVGASMWPNSNEYSKLWFDWNTGSGTGPKGSVDDNFITANDLGKWMEVKIHVKAATATQKGTLQVWKNGTLVIDNSGKVDNYHSGEAHAYRHGYLLGWANSGFSKDTYLYLDDVVFGTQESDLGGETDTTLSPPTSLRIVE